VREGGIEAFDPLPVDEDVFEDTDDGEVG